MFRRQMRFWVSKGIIENDRNARCLFEGAQKSGFPVARRGRAFLVAQQHDFSFTLEQRNQFFVRQNAALGVIGRHKRREISSRRAFERRINDDDGDFFGRRTFDRLDERYIIERRQNDGAHAVGNELLHDANLSSAVRFLDRAFENDVGAHFFPGFTGARLHRFPVGMGRAFGNHGDGRSGRVISCRRRRGRGRGIGVVATGQSQRQAASGEVEFFHRSGESFNLSLAALPTKMRP